MIYDGTKTPETNLLAVVNSASTRTLKLTQIEFKWPGTTGSTPNSQITVGSIVNKGYYNSVNMKYNRLELSKHPVILSGYIFEVPNGATVSNITALICGVLGLPAADIQVWYSPLPTYGLVYWQVGIIWNSLTHFGAIAVPVKYK